MIVFTVIALILSGEVAAVWEFFQYNPTAFWYSTATSITSATGQIAIFYCIRKYGPTVFTIIMTTRQVFSIMLSNMLFGHSTPMSAVAGATLVFGAVFYSSYRQMQKRQGDSNGGGHSTRTAAEVELSSRSPSNKSRSVEEDALSQQGLLSSAAGKSNPR